MTPTCPCCAPRSTSRARSTSRPSPHCGDAPDDPRLLNNLAHLLATCPERICANPTQAVELARKACTLDETPARLDTLAAALAAAGQWDEAIRTQEKAMEDAPRGDREAMRERLHAYIGERGV